MTLRIRGRRNLRLLPHSLRQTDNPSVSARLIVPTLCVGMPLRTLRVQGDAERHSPCYHAERGNNQISARLRPLARIKPSVVHYSRTIGNATRKHAPSPELLTLNRPPICSTMP